MAADLKSSIPDTATGGSILGRVELLGVWFGIKDDDICLDRSFLVSLDIKVLLPDRIEDVEAFLFMLKGSFLF